MKIVALLRSHHPIADADALEAAAEIDRLRAALIKYGAHEPECGEPCDCGLDAELEKSGTR